MLAAEPALRRMRWGSLKSRSYDHAGDRRREAERPGTMYSSLDRRDQERREVDLKRVIETIVHSSRHREIGIEEPMVETMITDETTTIGIGKRLGIGEMSTTLVRRMTTGRGRSIDTRVETEEMSEGMRDGTIGEESTRTDEGEKTIDIGETDATRDTEKIVVSTMLTRQELATIKDQEGLPLN